MFSSHILIVFYSLHTLDSLILPLNSLRLWSFFFKCFSFFYISLFLFIFTFTNPSVLLPPGPIRELESQQHAYVALSSLSPVSGPELQRSPIAALLSAPGVCSQTHSPCALVGLMQPSECMHHCALSQGLSLDSQGLLTHLQMALTALSSIVSAPCTAIQKLHPSRDAELKSS